jgi:AmiR/NasT family two-component response regulator
MKRDIIGQGKGILMERDKIRSDAAFECLSLASQRLNIKLTEVAQRLVETGELLS